MSVKYHTCLDEFIDKLGLKTSRMFTETWRYQASEHCLLRIRTRIILYFPGRYENPPLLTDAPDRIRAGISSPKLAGLGSRKPDVIIPVQQPPFSEGLISLTAESLSQFRKRSWEGIFFPSRSRLLAMAIAFTPGEERTSILETIFTSHR
jgi:hypothetical protein